MGSWGVCDEEGWRKGPWTPQEDKMLIDYVANYGEGRWSSVSKCTGLRRSGKSCRLRWVNYLRPGLKKGHLTPQEEGIIIELHALWGNKWSTIARYLPGRTDNEIKNYWRTHFKKRSPPPSSNPVNPNKKRKLVLQVEKEEKQEDNSSTTDHKLDNRASGTTYSSNDNRDPEMILPADYEQDGVSWFDYSIPVDCLMWDGLWNLDDGCTRMGAENEASFVGINGTCIF